MVLEEANAFTGIHHLHIEALPQGPQGLVRGLHAHIGLQQQRFQVVQHLRRERIVAQVGEQLGDEIAAGFFQPTAQAPQPIDLFQGHLIGAPALGRQHLSGPGEIGIKGAELGFGVTAWGLAWGGRNRGFRGDGGAPGAGSGGRWRRRGGCTDPRSRRGRWFIDRQGQQLPLALGPLGRGQLQQ